MPVNQVIFYRESNQGILPFSSQTLFIFIRRLCAWLRRHEMAFPRSPRLNPGPDHAFDWILQPKSQTSVSASLERKKIKKKYEIKKYKKKVEIPDHEKKLETLNWLDHYLKTHNPRKRKSSLFLHRRCSPLAELLTLRSLLVNAGGQELGVVVAIFKELYVSFGRTKHHSRTKEKGHLTQPREKPQPYGAWWRSCGACVAGAGG